MKLLHLLCFLFVAILYSSCSKNIDYGSDITSLQKQINLINTRLDSLTNAIKTITTQITNIDLSLRTKIEIANSRIDSVSSTLKTISNTNLSSLSNDIKAINNSITTSNTNTQKQIDSINNYIKKIDSTINISTSSSTSLKDSYNQLLGNYLAILKIVKVTPSIIAINGSVFKGSFIRGSLLFFFELDSSLNQTGRSFNTTIEDDYGNFSLKAQNLSGKLVRVVGDGFYWNEVLNENSSTRITLTGISRIDSNQTVNVNVLTHLERPRVEYLYSVMGYSFDSAKSQAITEVLKAFGYNNTGIKRAEKVGIFGVGDDSKILLAISTMIQGFRSESEVTTLLNDIAEDV
jgi:hypothetical protein